MIMKYHFAFFLFIHLCVYASAQKNITLDDMRQRYAEFANLQAIDPTISKENDEVVKSSYLCYKEEGKKYQNPRLESPQDYGFMLADNLRTPEYPERRHFWSLVEYEKTDHRTFSTTDTRKMKPAERRKWKNRHKGAVQYLALDSIEGVSTSSWSKDFKKKYDHRKQKFHYAKAVSDTLFLLNEVRNMMGYTVAPHFQDVIIKKGCVRYNSPQRCEDQMGDLMFLGGMPTLDGRERSKYSSISRRLSALADDVNSRLTVVDRTIGKKSYDLLIKMLPDGKVDAEILSCTGEPGSEFERLRECLCELHSHARTDAGYFVRYWTANAQPLPGFYLQANLREDGTWWFSMEKFLLNLVWKVW